MAKRAPFLIGDHTIAAGERRTVDLPVSVLSDHTPVTMSAHVIHGRNDGPTMFVTAGVHGDEVIGVEIVRRLLGIKGLGRIRGTLIAIPIVNTFGFLNHSRYLPDRRDLNRSFPGSATGSLAARLADLLMNQVIVRCDFGIDLHSAAIHRTNLPQVRVSPGNPETLRMAGVFGAPVMLTAKQRDGSLRAAASQHDVDVLLYEAGEGMRFDEFGVRVGVKGIQRIMQDHGMIQGKVRQPRQAQPLSLESSRWLRAPQGGLLRVYRDTGDVVAEGDVLASVSDPFGDCELAVVAKAPGIIIGRAVMPVVNEGDALFHIGEVASTGMAEDTMDAVRDQLDGDPLFDEDEII